MKKQQKFPKTPSQSPDPSKGVNPNYAPVKPDTPQESVDRVTSGLPDPKKKTVLTQDTRLGEEARKLRGKL